MPLIESFLEVYRVYCEFLDEIGAELALIQLDLAMTHALDPVVFDELWNEAPLLPSLFFYNLV